MYPHITIAWHSIQMRLHCIALQFIVLCYPLEMNRPRTVKGTMPAMPHGWPHAIFIWHTKVWSLEYVLPFRIHVCFLHVRMCLLWNKCRMCRHNRDHIPFNSFPTYHCPWRMFLVSQDISSRIIDLNETRIVRALVRLFVLGLSKNRPWCVFRPLGGNRIGNRQSPPSPHVRHVISGKRERPGTAPRCETGVAWDFPLAKSEKRELLLQHFAATERCEFVEVKCSTRSFQKASRRLPDLLEIGWKLELVLKNFGSWNHGVHIGVPICSRLKIKKCVAPAVVWPG